MKIRFFTSVFVSLALFIPAFADDDDHKTIEKVMKEGLKGDDSPFGKIKAGTATAEDYSTLYELARTLRGTTAPKGEQAGYDEKVAAFIKAAGAAHYADAAPEFVSALKEAANCKACHSDHKPD